MTSVRRRLKDALRIRNEYVRLFLAELLSTFILIAFGLGANAQLILSRHKAGPYLTNNIAWGWSVAMATWVSFGISGAHLNPAVTFAMFVLGRRTIKQLLVYWVGQYIGAFAASAAVYGVYKEALDKFDGGNRAVVGENATAGIWATYPQPYLSTQAGFGDQVFGSMMLLLVCMAVTDKFNTPPTLGLIPMCIGSVITLIGMTYNLNCGGAINPARDFSPRLFTAIAGWGVEVFTVYNYWFWVPLVAPHIGTVCGALIYLVFIGIHTQPLDPEEQSIAKMAKKLSPQNFTGMYVRKDSDEVFVIAWRKKNCEEETNEELRARSQSSNLARLTNALTPEDN